MLGLKLGDLFAESVVARVSVVVLLEFQDIGKECGKGCTTNDIWGNGSWIGAK